MESNAMTSYKDTTPAARLDKQTLNKWYGVLANYRLRSTTNVCNLLVGYGLFYQVWKNPHK